MRHFKKMTAAVMAVATLATSIVPTKIPSLLMTLQWKVKEMERLRLRFTQRTILT